MKLTMTIISMLAFSSCITNHNIEERCLSANLQIERLTIEDTLKNDALARVTCVKRSR